MHNVQTAPHLAAEPPENDKDPQHEQEEHHEPAPVPSLSFSHDFHPRKCPAEKSRRGCKSVVLID